MPTPRVGNSPMRSIGIRRVVDADHSGAGGKIVLGREKQLAVGRIGAVAEEMPVRRRDENLRRDARMNVEGDGEGARPAREGDGAAACRMHGEIVAARRKRDLADEVARSRRTPSLRSCRPTASPARAPAPRSSPAPRRSGARARRQGRRPRRQGASGGRRSFAQSPSSELNPGESPAATAMWRLEEVAEARQHDRA